MKNVVHGVDFGVCQWTGEAIKKRFKIPKPNPSKPSPDWVGCYGSPSVAVSALTQMAHDLKMVPEKTNELIDHFQDSLRRSVGYENEAFTIQPAPSWKNLTHFGGLTGLDNFHKSYDHDFQTKAFEQMILPAKQPPNTPVPQEPIEPPKTWSYSKITCDKGNHIETSSVQVPRSFNSWREFISANNCWSGVSPNSVVLYFHPTNDKLMAVGSPVAWNETLNKRASEAFGKTPVYGDVMVFHKTKLYVPKTKDPKDPKDPKEPKEPKDPQETEERPNKKRKRNIKMD